MCMEFTTVGNISFLGLYNRKKDEVYRRNLFP
jgi:hypothetical protein